MKYIFWLHNAIPTEPPTYVIDGIASAYSNSNEQKEAYSLLLEMQKLNSSIKPDNLALQNRSEQLRFFCNENKFFMQDATKSKNGQNISFMFWADTIDEKEGKSLLFQAAELAGCPLVEDEYFFVDNHNNGLPVCEVNEHRFNVNPYVIISTIVIFIAIVCYLTLNNSSNKDNTKEQNNTERITEP